MQRNALRRIERSTGVWIKKSESTEGSTERTYLGVHWGDSVSEYDGGKVWSRLFGCRLVIGVAAQKAHDLLSLKLNFESSKSIQNASAMQNRESVTLRSSPAYSALAPSLAQYMSVAVLNSRPGIPARAALFAQRLVYPAKYFRACTTISA